MGVRSALGMACIATVLSLSFALAQAGEPTSRVPIFSSSDGSRGWVEISQSGNREKAVPMIEVSGKTTRQAAAAGETGKELLAPRGGKEGKEAEKRPDIGEFLKQHKSLVIEESAEGVSLYNALDLLGEIQEAIPRNRDTHSDRRNPVSDTVP